MNLTEVTQNALDAHVSSAKAELDDIIASFFKRCLAEAEKGNSSYTFWLSTRLEGITEGQLKARRAYIASELMRLHSVRVQYETQHNLRGHACRVDMNMSWGDFNRPKSLRGF